MAAHGEEKTSHQGDVPSGRVPGTIEPGACEPDTSSLLIHAVSVPGPLPTPPPPPQQSLSYLLHSVHFPSIDFAPFPSLIPVASPVPALHHATSPAARHLLPGLLRTCMEFACQLVTPLTFPPQPGPRPLFAGFPALSQTRCSPPLAGSSTGSQIQRMGAKDGKAGQTCGEVEKAR